MVDMELDDPVLYELAKLHMREAYNQIVVQRQLREES